jgi:hypothetical protein
MSPRTVSVVLEGPNHHHPRSNRRREGMICQRNVVEERQPRPLMVTPMLRLVQRKNPPRNVVDVVVLPKMRGMVLQNRVTWQCWLIWLLSPWRMCWFLRGLVFIHREIGLVSVV